jgi:microcystin-dependent protein
MASPFLGEIRMFGGNFAPRGWAFCNGQLISISQNTALFSLLGTTYGGNGITTFALPNLQSRVPVHWGTGAGLSSYVIGQQAGQENVTLLQSQMPAHTHSLNAVTSGGNQATPTGNFPAVESTGTSLNYSSGPANTAMNPAAVAVAGQSLPVPVVQPYLAVSFIIALAGIFPSRN